MPTGRQRRNQINQRQKRREKNRGGKRLFDAVENRIKSARRKKRIFSDPTLAKDNSQSYETKNLSQIEQHFRKCLRLTPSGDQKRLTRYTLAVLAHLRKHSEPMYFHSVRVGLLSHYLLQQEKASIHKLRLALYGGALHDTGKLVSPQEILKGGEITKAQFAEISRHATEGFDLLKADYALTAAVAGLHHKEHAHGYGIDPHDLKVHSVPYLARMLHDVTTAVALADWVDASLSRYGQPSQDIEYRGITLRQGLLHAYPTQADRIQRLLESPLLKLFYSRSPE